MSTVSFCTTTVGSTIQNFTVCTPGFAMTCVVTVRFTLSEVFLRHCRFMVASLAPVAVLMLTSWGAASSIETAYCSPPCARTSLRGDRYARTFTDPLLNVVIVYSSRGLLPPGVWLDAVTGNGSAPESVRPMSGMRVHVTPLLLTARV